MAKEKANRKDILNILNKKIRKLEKEVFCKHHNILLESSYDGYAECPKDTRKCSGCSNDELASYKELLNLKESISKRDFNLRNKLKEVKPNSSSK